MGGGTGGAYSARGSTRVARNFRTLTNRYPIDRTGRFGTQGSRRDVRRVASENPHADARRFFKIATRGADRVWEERPGVFRARFRDGSHVTYRTRSHSDGSPAVDFLLTSRPHGVANAQRIHFTPKIPS